MRNLRERYRAFAERPPSTRHVDVLDGIRALGVLIVAWFHIWQQSWLWPGVRGEIAGFHFQINLDPLVRTGYIMVDLMLLISGFLLFLPYARHMLEGERLPDTGAFYLKRGLRILPSYWLCIFVVLFAFALPEGQFYSAGQMWKDILSHLTFTHVFWFDSYVATRLNVVLWTLAIEVQFYLIFPWLARAFVKKPWLTWALMVAGGLAFRYLVVLDQPDTNLWVNQMPTFLDVYANGMLAALCYVSLAKSLKHTPWTRALFTVLALVLLVPLWGIIKQHASSMSHEMIRINQTKLRFMFGAYLSLFIVAAANAAAWFRWLFSNKVMRIASAISLQYYIWHQYIAAKLHNDWHFPPSVSLEPHVDAEQPWQWLFTICAFGIPLVLSLLLTYGFEQPIARWGMRRWQQYKQKKQVRLTPARMEETQDERSENGHPGA